MQAFFVLVIATFIIFAIMRLPPGDPIERTRHGPFKCLVDFLDRTNGNVHLQDARILIKAGCFDSISHGVLRPGLVWQTLRFFNRKEEEKRSPTLIPVSREIPLDPLY